MKAILLAVAVWCLAAPLGAEPADHHFRVFLDGDEIGTHSFRFQPLGDGPAHYRLVSEASYEVKILFVKVYQYDHRSVETWRQGCLEDIQAVTDDNGEKFQVAGEQLDTSFRVEVNGERRTLEEGCVGTFAYWEPDLLTAPRLLNSQTGELEDVALERLGERPLPWDETIEATALSLESEAGTIRLWYHREGHWLGLRSRLGNGRVLEYRADPSSALAAKVPTQGASLPEWAL